MGQDLFYFRGVSSQSKFTRCCIFALFIGACLNDFLAASIPPFVPLTAAITAAFALVFNRRGGGTGFGMG